MNTDRTTQPLLLNSRDHRYEITSADSRFISNDRGLNTHQHIGNVTNTAERMHTRVSTSSAEYSDQETWQMISERQQELAQLKLKAAVKSAEVVCTPFTLYLQRFQFGLYISSIMITLGIIAKNIYLTWGNGK